MNQLAQRFLQTLQKVKVLEKGQKIVVAASGGVDSTSLLWLFREVSPYYPLDLVVAHYNHALRGKESQEDEDFIKALAHRLQLPFAVDSPPKGYWEKAKGNKMDEARKLRYRFFHDVAKKQGAQAISLAHHSDDQAETILFHLLRGSGLKGLAGMSLQQGMLLRPLLPFRRQELVEYMNLIGEAWREDSSNQSLTYSRNRLRHQVLPLLETFNPRLIESLNRTADLIRAEDAYLEERTQEVYKQVCTAEGLHIASWLQLPLALRRRILYHYLRKHHSSAFLGLEKINEIEQKLSAKGSASPEITQVAGKRVVREEGLLKLCEEMSVEERPYSYELTIPESYYEQSCQPIHEALGKVTLCCFPLNDERDKANVQSDPLKKKGKHILWLDDKVLKEGKLLVRSRRPGDRFWPLGMKGSKKVKDFLIDEKVPRRERNSVPLLVVGEKILWVMSYRADRRYLANQDSTGLIEVRWDKNI
ncbi:tRNA lysidine(34) synthetase TilS [Heliorestis convoluta]|uniref:tRNA(Ile)-lysidine synthase n=1 Tax=Heliorestis convoluta TaxID=356322 RepID=A0A5Q2N4A2_9FIRM|nr:tRNA lysidine(34) synthetase TilS [Heliorestis convoluta]QGG48743.1 tRNA(Ile)-lysidine synthase [Heliorestis convoluta]